MTDIHDDSLQLARETMTGDLRDCILDFLKHEKNPLPWNMQTEEQQSDAIHKVTDAVTRAVEKAVALIAADGRQVIEAILDQVTVKDEIKAVCKVSKSNALRHDLMDATGYSVLLVVSDAGVYKGERKPALPEPNEPPLFDQTDAGAEDKAA
jgi:hypothetical protein